MDIFLLLNDGNFRKCYYFNIQTSAIVKPLEPGRNHATQNNHFKALRPK
ncbi:MAG TPA: hypothetical protein PKN32_14940 [Bacteroidales bacterium]|nr:hypothetical protein [Bacteroidales bacterium]